MAHCSFVDRYQYILGIYQIIWYHIPKDGNFYIYFLTSKNIDTLGRLNIYVVIKLTKCKKYLNQKTKTNGAESDLTSLCPTFLLNNSSNWSKPHSALPLYVLCETYTIFHLRFHFHSPEYGEWNVYWNDWTASTHNTNILLKPKYNIMPLPSISQITSSPSIWLLFVHGCYETAS